LGPSDRGHVRSLGLIRVFLGSTNSIGRALNMVLLSSICSGRTIHQMATDRSPVYPSAMSIVGVLLPDSARLLLCCSWCWAPLLQGVEAGDVWTCRRNGFLACSLLLRKPFLPDQWWERMGSTTLTIRIRRREPTHFLREVAFLRARTAIPRRRLLGAASPPNFSTLIPAAESAPA